MSFILGMIVGGIVGFAVCAHLAIARESDNQERD